MTKMHNPDDYEQPEAAALSREEIESMANGHGLPASSDFCEGRTERQKSQVKKGKIPDAPPWTVFENDANGVVYKLTRVRYRHISGLKLNYIVLRGLSCNNFSIHIENPDSPGIPGSLFVGKLSILAKHATFESQPLDIISDIFINTEKNGNGDTDFKIISRSLSDCKVFDESVGTASVLPVKDGNDYLKYWSELITKSLDIVFSKDQHFNATVKKGFAEMENFNTKGLPVKKPDQAQIPKTSAKNAMADFMYVHNQSSLSDQQKGLSSGKPSANRPTMQTSPPAVPVCLIDISGMSKSDLQVMMYRVDNVLRGKRIEKVRASISRTTDRITRIEYDRMLQELQKGRNVFIDDCLDRLELRLNIDE